MRLVIAAVGRLKDAERELCARYIERVNASGRSVALGPVDLREIPESRRSAANARMAEEVERLLAASRDADFRIVLDESGKPLTSAKFADLLSDARDRGTRSAAFLIGGPDGHGEAARKAADVVLALGPMTLPHGLARIVLAEQIYRAATILAGHPYHRR